MYCTQEKLTKNLITDIMITVVKIEHKKHPPIPVGERHTKVNSFNDYYIMAGAIFKALGDKLGSKSKGTRLPVR
ncbi:hypothetical protein EFP30_09760, partial [Lactiplantibacillus pentosus]|nr:hypothetical protein [Lactiplantibacillus pentosus]